MKRIISLTLISVIAFWTAIGQTPTSQKPGQQSQEEILRITTELVQTDVVVTDRNDQIVRDLALEDFDVYDNGKKQQLQFVEFVSAEAPADAADMKGRANVPGGVDTSVARELSAKDLRRVIAFVVDDVTIPSEDMVRARQMLTDFVDNKMQTGDLVAIIRTVGGKGLLEQFTTDRSILRRAIAQLGVRSIPPYLAFGGDEPGRITSVPAPFADTTASETVESSQEFEGPSEGTNKTPRAILALAMSNYIVDSLRQIPGRKNLVLISGGLPLFDFARTGAIIGDVTQLFRELTDNATRSGVVINTLDVRGLKAQGAVANFNVTPAKSALGGGTFAGSDINTAGVYDPRLLGERSLTEQLSLTSLAATTGGVSVINSNNFSAGLDKVLNRARGYYRLAYRPSEKFDNKFHKLNVKARRSAHVYNAEGYVAREDKPSSANTKEEEIAAAARSPLVKRDLDVAAELLYKFSPDNQAVLDINTFIDARKLSFAKTAEGKYHTSFDVAGFVLDELGRSRGGISQTINADLSEQDYRRALSTGISYTASTKLSPGYYQVRLVVREVDTHNIGTVSRYFEVPDLNNKQLTMSSMFLYAISSGDKKSGDQLPATRVISRKTDLQYVAVIYNAKTDGSKPQLRSRLIISQAGKVLFQEPEQPLEQRGNAEGQYVKRGQLGLAKVQPGRYVLTFVVNDNLADKKHASVSRSIDFTVVD
ncbi:MAG TPA: VWA domain-containing protein [Pyrinomonadaceae bacterium]|jgi:VWFA-related protein